MSALTADVLDLLADARAFQPLTVAHALRVHGEQAVRRAHIDALIVFTPADGDDLPHLSADWVLHRASDTQRRDHIAVQLTAHGRDTLNNA